MLMKAKAIALAFAIAAFTLVGLVSPAVATAAPTSVAAVAVHSLAVPSGQVAQGCGMKVFSPVAVRNAPTATARIIGYVNRTWSVSGGPGCRFGYARFYAGTWYAWGGKPN